MDVNDSTLSGHMASTEMVTVLEECRVSPPSSTAVDEKSLPLTFFDIPWIHQHLVQSVFFYEYPHPKTHFIETTIPALKHSLSLTLKHFYPFAGNLLFPPNLGKPQIHYADGDSVSLTFVESSDDFSYLTANHQRDVARLHPLIPQMPPVSVSNDTLVAPLVAIQVTLFPNSGISFGFTSNHVVADGNTFIRFVRLWASINKLGEESMTLEGAILPFYDRTMVKDSNGVGSIFWQHMGKKKIGGYQPQLPTNNVLGTFLLSQAHLQRLKRWVMVQCPKLPHVSSLTVACGYTWACVAKARARSSDEVDENELQHFVFPVDCRARLNPPLPENYFGNCLAPCFVAIKSTQLIDDEDGFVAAVNAMGEALGKTLQNEEGVLRGAEKWLSDLESLNKERTLGASASPKFAVYNIDFGFGRLQKREMISIDETNSISLHEGKTNMGDIEVGVALPKMTMDVFASIFANGLKVYD